MGLKIYTIALGGPSPLRVPVRGGDTWPPLPSTPVWPLHLRPLGLMRRGQLPTVNSPAPQLGSQFTKKELWVTSLLWSDCHGNKLSLISSVVTMAIF